jgi:hypothetical protein
LGEINEETKIINGLCDEWGIEKSKISETASRFFNGYKKYQSKINKLDQTLLEYQVKFILLDPNNQVGYHLTDHEEPRIYFSNMDAFAEQLFNAKKGIIFYNDGFVFGMLPDLSLEKPFKEFFESHKVSDVELKYKSQNSVAIDKKKKVEIYKFSVFHKFNLTTLANFFNRENWIKI